MAVDNYDSFEASFDLFIMVFSFFSFPVVDVC